jgi:hypothetical protein
MATRPTSPSTGGPTAAAHANYFGGARNANGLVRYHMPGARKATRKNRYPQIKHLRYPQPRMGVRYRLQKPKLGREFGYLQYLTYLVYRMLNKSITSIWPPPPWVEREKQYAKLSTKGIEVPGPLVFVWPMSIFPAYGIFRYSRSSMARLSTMPVGPAVCC